MSGSAFSEYGADSKLGIRPTVNQSLTLWYAHTALEGVRSYRDQLGGVGRVLSRSTPQGLDFLYARYEKLRVGFLDSLSGTFSLNSQKDGTTRGGIRFTDSVTIDRSKVDSYGYTAQGTTHLGARNTLVFGGELYDEHVFSTRFSRNPVLQTTSQDRAQYPNDSRYRTSGVFLQDATELMHGKLRAVLGMRLSDIGFHSYADRNRTTAGLLLGVADSSRTFRDLTFNGSLAWHVHRTLSVHALVGRGFRAPNLNDLGSIGVTTLGYDMPIEEVLPFGPLMGADSSEGSLWSGKTAQRLGAESLFNYETGVNIHAGKLYARLHVFDAELFNPIASRTLLFPIDKVPASIAGIPVKAMSPTTAQLKQGVTGVVTSLSTRAVKASLNDGHTRYYGLESLVRYRLSSRWALEGNYSFIAGRDLNPNRPVRRLPPQQGLARVRYTPAGRRVWLNLGCRFAGAQSRLAGGDLDDDRLGATRSRSDIANFFNGGMAGAFIVPGPDGRKGTADDVFSPTGETVGGIRERVLPLNSTVNGVRIIDDNTRVPMYLRTDGWWSVDLLGGVPLGERLTLRFGISNWLDKNYRIHGSGIDAPGRDLFVGFRYAF